MSFFFCFVSATQYEYIEIASGGEFEFERSQRGRPILKYRGFRYRRERAFGDSITWRCAHKNCKGRLSLNQVNCSIIKSSDHDLCFERVRHRQERSILKNETVVVDDDDIPPSSMFFIPQ